MTYKNILTIYMILVFCKCKAKSNSRKPKKFSGNSENKFGDIELDFTNSV